MRHLHLAALLLLACDAGSSGGDAAPPADLATVERGVEDLAASRDLHGGGGDAAAAADLQARDLAEPADLAAPPDLSAPRDLAVPPDLRPPPDLTRPDGGPDWHGVDCDPEVCVDPAPTCCRRKPYGAGACIGAGKGCHVSRFPCDDPDDCGANLICCLTGIIGSTCMGQQDCLNRAGDLMCRDDLHCPVGERCCGTMGSPAYFCARICPL